MGKVKDCNKKNDDMRGLQLRPKLSLSDTISNLVMSEKIAITVVWILFILLIIWLLSMLS
jgi:hypothetical protein